MLIKIKCIDEDQPGEKWAKVFNRTWPYYRAWYLQEGFTARPGYLSCSEALEEYMPELVPLYENVCELAGGGDVASRYLSMWNPPAFMSGCTQVAWTKDRPALIRNYDYNPKWFEGVMLKSNWLQPVMGVSDCNWGLLDGMNASGLCASLNFGGRNVVGEGFGIPLVIRYLLETCKTVGEAITALNRIPVHMAYNVMLMDRNGKHATLFLGPDRKPGLIKKQACTNHQEDIEWPEYARQTQTIEREKAAETYLKDEKMTLDSIFKKFLQPPLHQFDLKKSFGTLYSAAWFPKTGESTLFWKGKELHQSFEEFNEQQITVQITKQAESLIY
ncbi:C45 family peptidase [Rhodohalobacter sp. 8-1]|uniref:C45 family peptidase n=1 Tax=Rhodohalobacter sp. 8-1 TaxID=3131972 RepID=UPI0030EB648A